MLGLEDSLVISDTYFLPFQFSVLQVPRQQNGTYNQFVSNTWRYCKQNDQKQSFIKQTKHSMKLMKLMLTALQTCLNPFYRNYILPVAVVPQTLRDICIKEITPNFEIQSYQSHSKCHNSHIVNYYNGNWTFLWRFEQR